MMAIRTRPKNWDYFPTETEWEATDPTERIRQSARLLIDSVERVDHPVTERTRIAIYTLKRALSSEKKVD